MSFFEPAPEPATELGRLRILSSTAGIRVSPLQLGAMSIGDAWAGMMGSMDKKQSFALLDAFAEAGGNFIDTANNYQNEQSEQWLGEWMQERGNRDQMVIATKFTVSCVMLPSRQLLMSMCPDRLQGLRSWQGQSRQPLRKRPPFSAHERPRLAQETSNRLHRHPLPALVGPHHLH